MGRVIVERSEYTKKWGHFLHSGSTELGLSEPRPQMSSPDRTVDTALDMAEEPRFDDYALFFVGNGCGEHLHNDLS